jgi:2-dehydropantoate 2-reductase
VKAWQVPEAAEALAPLLGPDTAVLPLLNGVEAYDQLADAVGKEHVLGGLCRILAHQAEPASSSTPRSTRPSTSASGTGS